MKKFTAFFILLMSVLCLMFACVEKDPADPDPIDPIIPTDPTDPTDPTNPTDPAEPQLSDKIKTERGVIAVKSTAAGIFISWRLYIDDPDDITFNIYREDTKLNSTPLGPDRTNYQDASGTAGAKYKVEMIWDSGKFYNFSEVTTALSTDYIQINLVKPVNNYLSDGSVYSGEYSPANGTVADLDGDGTYEIIFFWEPQNLQDNSISGRTGNVYIDAYKLDGTRMWSNFIDLGPNIRAGAHYQTFVVYDFDGDGKAEIAVKTADGTKDTQGTVIGQAGVYHANSSGSRGGGSPGGYVLSGAEYLTLFDGATGRILDTVDYIVPRGSVSTWGDSYGNRVDRFLSCAAYLGGTGTSLIMQRGYYTRTVLAAWDWNGSKLVHRWTFDSNNYSNTAGQGYHSLSVADVDNDGFDEIILGSLCIDHNGTPLWNSRQGHGDALHVGDFDPDRPGLEIVTVHEESPYGLSMKDASNGAVIWRINGASDTGRGLTASIDPDTRGSFSWTGSGSNAPGIYNTKGTQIAASTSGFSTNMAIFWDGDTGRELFDGGNNYWGSTGANCRITKISKAANGNFSGSTYKDFGDTVSTWSTTKQNPLVQVDIIGDWREEIILRAKDNSFIRIYTTTASTVHSGPGKVPAYGIPTLMDDHQYRMAIVWQNAGYNQPPHTSWYIGYNMENLHGPKIPVTGMTFNKNFLSVIASFSDQIIAEIVPPDANDKTITWTSSNTAIATVSDGVVTGAAPGTAVITARTRDGGFEAACQVEVTSFGGVTLFEWNADTDAGLTSLPVTGKRIYNGKTMYSFSQGVSSPAVMNVVNAGDKLKGDQAADIELTITRNGYVLRESNVPCLQIGSDTGTRTTTSAIPNTNGEFDLRKPFKITVEYSGVSKGSNANGSGIMIAMLNNTGNVATSPLGSLSASDISLEADGIVKTHERIVNPEALGFNASQMNMLSTGFITIRCVRAAGILVLHSVKIEQVP